MKATVTRAEVRTWQFLVLEGGYWTARECSRAFGLVRHDGVAPQLTRLYQGGYTVRKGRGMPNDPFRYGVTARCKTPIAGGAL